MRLANVHVRYRDRAIAGHPVAALKDVSISIRPGEKVGVIGGNGSGKSTLLRVMGGVLQPDDGGCQAEGMSTASAVAQRGVRPGSVRCPQHRPARAY